MGSHVTALACGLSGGVWLVTGPPTALQKRTSDHSPLCYLQLGGHRCLKEADPAVTGPTPLVGSAPLI
jgi:hypothetical protein